MARWVFAATAIATTTLAAQGEDDWAKKDQSPVAITVYAENDSTFLKRNHPTDRHYTHGTKITLAHQPAWAAGLAQRLPFNPAGEDQPLRSAAGYAIGQNIYTPDRIEVAALQPTDRPYAGWFYAGLYVQRATDTVFDHFEVDVGTTGPSSLAEDAQSWIHQIFDETDPRGWDNQLKDEPGVDFTFLRQWRTTLLTSAGQDVVQLIPQAGFTVGTVHRHAGIGATVRMGVGLPDDFGPGRIDQPTAATGLGDQSSGGYVFARLRGRVVEHNLFLNGNNFHSSHGVKPETWVGDFQVGLVVRWGAIEVGYSQTFLTQEFETQNTNDSFGGLTVSWVTEF